MWIKRLLPLAGLVALVGCANPGAPCFTATEVVIGIDSLGEAVSAPTQAVRAECSDLDHDF